MFAVKGWNLDAASLKPQTKPFDLKADESSGGKAQSRKRKRDAARDLDGSRDQVEALGFDPPGDQNGGKQSKKTKKTHNKPEHADAEHGSKLPQDHEVKAGEKSKRKKEKKRDRTAADQTAATDNDRPTKSTASKDSGQHVKTKHKSSEASTAAITQQQPQAISVPTPPAKSTSKLTPMQAAMRQKLVSARFRHLNETLYTAPSQQAQELFDANPNMFEEYHAGFRQQVAVWPENPVDKMLQKLRERGAIRLPNQKKAFKGKPGLAHSQPDSTTLSNALPRTKGVCTVADCGCGDARLAQTLKSANDLQRLNLNTLSYDLHSPSPHVTKADIANLPLADGSVDVVIFCLALMGTNWLSFIEEAYRVLRWKGELWIAEIKSRFGRVERKGANRVVEHSVGNRKKRAALAKADAQQRQARDEAAQEEALAVEVDGAEAVKSESDVQEFLKALERRGFVLRNGSESVDAGNKMFVSLELVKAAAPTKGKAADSKTSGPHKHKVVSEDVASEDEGKTLKPCLYKLR